jgi:dipeptidyl aminopeptidase/acylaminoacyl peptidase
MNGMTDYVLSPDEQSLALTHSKLVMPPELYSVDLTSSGAAPVKITTTVSDAFLSIDWVSPSIVAVPSSHTEQPIYSRVYAPEGASIEERPAVIFNHGAGYLQNSHLGWSGYFREFMFHSFLVSQGYVVMDMDYRASMGYGRDWRTAIYRQMGTPETQDLVDGVDWLVKNASVDRKRIGTYGGSYGGFMTFMALFTEPELFQAGAALRPVSDWAHYNDPYTSNILNRPDIDPIAYERSSPIYFADGLNKPLLINAPMVDDNVFFVDVVRLVQILIEKEKENFETAIYPVEPHGFVQPSSWLDEYRRIFKLFEDNVKPVK